MIVKSRNVNKEYLDYMFKDNTEPVTEERIKEVLTDQESLEEFFKQYLKRKGFSRFQVLEMKDGSNYYKFIK